MNDIVGQIDDVMTLQRLLGKSVIRTIYYVGAVLYTIGGFIVLVWAIDAEAWWTVGLTIVFGVAGNVAWRLACELCILLYYMHEKLVSIDKTLKAK